MSDPADLPALRREAIIVALMQQVAGGVAPVPVERNRRSMADAEETPLLVLYDGGQSADTSTFGETAYELSLSIDGTVSAPDDNGLGPAISELYARTLAAVLADNQLGGLCTDVTEGDLEVRIATTEESAAPLAFFSLALTVNFRTPYGDPYG